MTGASILEWRHYVAAPGRADDLLRRFREGTLQLFADHGMVVSAFGQDLEDPHHLHYVVAWADRETMDSTWAAFAADARWQDLRARSEADGPLVESIDSRVLAAI
jgi:hypothetical protein